MPKGKQRATSPVAELEELDPADQDPEEDANPAPPKKKKSSKKDKPAEAQPPKKKSKKAAEPPPEDEEEEPVEEDDTGIELDWDKIREYSKEFRSTNRRLPKAAELVLACGNDMPLAKKVYNKLKNEADALKNKKKSKKIRGFHKISQECGYAKMNTTTDESYKSINGADILHPMISMADTARLTTYLPCTPDAVTVSEGDFAAHLELVQTTLPQSVAREITANVEPMFRFCMNSAAKAQLAAGGTKINPCTMMHVLKPMVEHLAFPSVLAPPGLVKFTKDAVPPLRKEYDAGESGLKKYKKALAEFNKATPLANRGIAITGFDPDDETEVKLMKSNAEDAAANGKAYEAMVKDVNDKKEKRVADRAAAKRKREETAVAAQ
jgi:hypothetical protein